MEYLVLIIMHEGIFKAWIKLADFAVTGTRSEIEMIILALFLGLLISFMNLFCAKSDIYQ